ncbi:MAG: hypothetical protein M0Z33_04295 [Actinomycetota bacterium]|nr:hypothetical protein [Actinomycetota bacterium]
MARDRVEARERLVEDQQVGMTPQRDGASELRLLATRELSHPALRGDLERAQAPRREGTIEAPVQAGRHVDHLVRGEMPVERRVLCDEDDPVPWHRSTPPAGRGAR